MTSNSPFWNEDLMKTMKAISNATKLMGESVATFYSYIDENREIIANIIDSVQKTGKVLATIAERIYTPTNIELMNNMSSAVLAAQRILNDYSAVVGDWKTVSIGSLAETLSTLAIETTDYSDIIKNFDIDEARELINSGAITQEEIKAEIDEITANPKEKLSLFEKLDDFKKTKIYIALLAIWFVVKLLAAPIIDEVKDNFYEVTGIQQFYEDAGVMDFIESIFDLNTSYAVSEEEAKATVDKSQTGNISKQNREDLLGKIKEIRTYIASAPQDENTGNLLKYLSEIEKDVNGQKYGLVFEEHREDIDVVLDTHTPVLTEQEELFIDNGGQMNFLIEGDNLASLKLLEKTHKKKVDLIYIDPPYNRGINDFKYDDNFITKSDGYIHSKWLSFMSERLKIAKNLLSPAGAIFISIDDNEQSNLKLLCDSIFGESCFAGMIPWRKRTAKTDVPFGISQDYEWILIYAKSEKFNAFIQRENQRKYYKTDDIPDREWRIHDLTKQTTAEERPNSYFTIVNPRNGQEFPANPNRTWAITSDTLTRYLAENKIVFPGDYDFLKISKPQLRYFRDEDEAKALKKTGSIAGISATTTQLPNYVGMTKEGTSDLGELFSEKAFPYPKPVDLIKYLIKIGTVNKENALILDFFAGSGTTAQSLMRYNAENEGSMRRFIVCTNNENNICREVTYERIKRVIDKENYEASLKYFKVEYVPIDEQMYYEYADELLCHVKELVELENGINFTENAEIGIVLTDEELFDFFENIDVYSKCKKLYIGHDLLLDEEQEAIVSKNGIQVIIIPDYYYRDLQEG